MGVAWRSQEAPGEELVFAGNLRLDEGQCRSLGLAELYEALRHLTVKYRLMELSPEEVVALKAMALANSGTHTRAHRHTHALNSTAQFLLLHNRSSDRLHKGRLRPRGAEEVQRPLGRSSGEAPHVTSLCVSRRETTLYRAHTL